MLIYIKSNVGLRFTFVTYRFTKFENFIIYNNNMELSAYSSANANVPSCFFCTELSASIKKVSSEFVNKKVSA